MRRAALAALTLAAAAGIPRPLAPGRPCRRPGRAERAPLTAHASPRALGRRHQLQPRRPLAGDQLLRRHPDRPRLPGRDPDPEPRARPRHRPARALGGRARTSSSCSPRRARANIDFDQGAPTPASTPTLPPPLAAGRLHLGVDRHRRAAARRPDRLPGGDATECRSDADIGFALGTNSPSTYEFRVRADQLRLQRGHRREQPRAAALGRGRGDLDAADHPGLRHRRRPSATTGTRPTTTTDERDHASPRPTSGSSTARPRTCASAAASATPTARASRRIDGVRDDRPSTTPARSSAATSATSCPDFTLTGDARWTTAAPQNRLSGVAARRLHPAPRPGHRPQVFQRYGGGQGGSDARVTGAGIGLDPRAQHRLAASPSTPPTPPRSTRTRPTSPTSTAPT